MGDTDKVASRSNTRQDDAAYGLLKNLLKLGGVGTGGLAVLIVGGMSWLSGRIEQSVKDVVREEVRPIDDRVRRLEVEAEVQKRLTETK